jgi:hypothetical protein
MADKGWQRELEDPITLPDGRELLTLRDAAEYITALPNAEPMRPTGKSQWKCCYWPPSATGRNCWRGSG